MGSYVVICLNYHLGTSPPLKQLSQQSRPHHNTHQGRCRVGGWGKGAALRRKRHQARSKIILKHESEIHVKADHVQSGVFHP